MRRPLVKAFDPPEGPQPIPVLIDRLQQAGIDLGAHKVRGSDYSRAVSSAALVEARANLDAAVAMLTGNVAEPVE